MYQTKFGQNPSTGSEDNAGKRSYMDADANAEADGIRTKSNMSPSLRLRDKINIVSSICMLLSRFLIRANDCNQMHCGATILPYLYTPSLGV